MAAPIPIVVPPNIAGMNAPSRYSIGYDFNYHSMKDPPPFGWGKNSGTVYRKVGENLVASGFGRDQYSLWFMNNTTPTHCYTSMVGMTRTDTLFVGMIPTMAQGLSMFHQPDNATMDVTNDVRLGGGLTPINPQNAIIPADLIPPLAIGLYIPAVDVPRIGRFVGEGLPADYRAA